MSAGTITVSETLELLDGAYEGFSAAIADGKFMLWVGSAISANRVDDLSAIMAIVIEHFRLNADLSDPDCAYHKALLEILNMCLSPADIAGIDLHVAFGSWTRAAEIKARLVNEYANVLSIFPAGKKSDYIVWDVIDVPGRYGTLTDPDGEHLCIAMMIREGVFDFIATPNWDGLIERAIDELGGGQQPCNVVVDATDMTKDGAKVVKFHGCAVRAHKDENRWRQFLVATTAQIDAWGKHAPMTAVRGALTAKAVEKNTLMVGLSAQDGNIRGLFDDVSNQLGWVWPPVDGQAPRLLTAGSQINADQRAVLQNGYKAFYENDQAEILAGSLFPAYAKATFSALAFHVLGLKLIHLAQKALAPKYDPADSKNLTDAIKYLRGLAAATVSIDKNENSREIRQFIKLWSRGMSIFIQGSPPAAGSSVYTPLFSGNVPTMLGFQYLDATGLKGLGVAASLIAQLALKQGWPLAVPANDDEVPLAIETANGTVGIALVGGVEAAVELVKQPFMDVGSNRLLVIHSGRTPDVLQRSPVLRRRGRVAPIVEVSMRDLIDQSPTLADLEDEFLKAAL